METRKEIESRIELFMSNIRKGLSYDANVVLLVNDIEASLRLVKNNVALADVRQQSELVCVCKNATPYLIDTDGLMLCDSCGKEIQTSA